MAPMCSMYSSIIWISDPSATWLRTAKSGTHASPIPRSASDTNGSIVVTAAEMGSFNIGVGPRLPEGPALELAGRWITVVQTHVQFQVGGRGRSAMPREVRWRTDNPQAVVAKAPRHKARVCLVSGADYRVVTSVDHVDNIVCELRVDLDFRILPHEPVQRGHHEHADVRQAHLQATFGRRFRLGEFEFDLVNLGEDAAAAFEEELALRRQGVCPRVAVEQPDAQAVLKPRYGLSD